MPDTRSEYGAGGGLTTTIGREGIETRQPDFWTDFDRMKVRMKPKPSPRASVQSEALSRPWSAPPAAAAPNPNQANPTLAAVQQNMAWLDDLQFRHGDFRPVEYAGHPYKNLVPAGTMAGLNLAAPADAWIKTYQQAAGGPSSQAVYEAGQGRARQAALGYGV